MRGCDMIEHDRPARWPAPAPGSARFGNTTLLLLAMLASPLAAQRNELDERWYQNPLRFQPLALHTRNGFLLPALAAGIALALTDGDAATREPVAMIIEGGWSQGYKYPYTGMAQASAGVLRPVRQWLAVGAAISGYRPRDAFNATEGVAARLFTRWYPLGRRRWRPHFEAGAGLVYFAEPFPAANDLDVRGGTPLNGTTQYGLGLEWSPGPHATLLVALRHVHVSNGNARGAERNPSHDSNGVFLGASLPL